MLDSFTNAGAHAETGQSPKATSPAKHIHPEERLYYSICPQIQVTTFVSLTFAEISAKVFKRVRKYVSLPRSHCPSSTVNAYFYSKPPVQRGQALLMLFIKFSPMAAEH